ncbi:hypothetical protein DL96DRAFT_1561302 [Flagelloscypha sp. PMI_526]|nr:hypothetical protein DL96DRAFT_1561302 [Flagelloscypha sp. PMI_526]
MSHHLLLKLSCLLKLTCSQNIHYVSPVFLLDAHLSAQPPILRLFITPRVKLVRSQDLPTLSKPLDNVGILCIAHLSSFCPGSSPADRLLTAKAQFYVSKAKELSESIPNDEALDLMSNTQLKEQMLSIFYGHKMILYDM